MLYIFNGKTRITQPVVDGKKAVRRDAGEAQSLIRTQIGDCENDSTIQERREGRFRKSFRQETVEERHDRKSRGAGLKFKFQPNRDLFDDEPLQQIEIGEVKETSRDVWISPNLKKDDGSPLTIDDFPQNWSFGNGVTTNVKVILLDGSIRRMSWCVLSTVAAQNTTDEKRETLRKIFEDK